MREPTILQVQAFAQEMRPDVYSLDEHWMPFFASQEYHLRFLTMTQRFNLQQPLQQLNTLGRTLQDRVRQLAPLALLVRQWHQALTEPSRADVLSSGFGDRMGIQAGGVNTPPAGVLVSAASYPALIANCVAELPPDRQREIAQELGRRDPRRVESWQWVLDRLGGRSWRRNWITEYSQMYNTLMTQFALRGLYHYLLAWLPEGVRPEDQVALVEQTFDTAAWVADLPSLLPGEYIERSNYLEPVEPHHPFIALLTSYDMKGRWQVDTLHRLLGLDIDIALCVDVGMVSRTRAEMQADFAIAEKGNTVSRTSGPRDPRANRQLEAAIAIQDALDTQSLHDLRIIVAVQAADEDELRQRVRQVKNAGGSRLKLMFPDYGQGPLTKFFGATPTGQIVAKTQPRRVLSQGAAVCVPFGMRKPDRTDGILWLLQGDTPIMFDPFADRRAGHAVVLGKTGAGKTFAGNCWLMRQAALGHQVVVYEPQGHSRRLIEACRAGGARFVLDLHQQINILDIIATRDEQGRPPSLAVQLEHVAAQLSVLLGQSTVGSDGKMSFTGRDWTNLERGSLDLALEQVYGDQDLEALTPERTPILSDLCDALSSVATKLDGEGERTAATAARTIASEINLRLVRGQLRKTFNAQTIIDWNFSRDVTAFDFSAIPEGNLRIFYYAQAFVALNRYVRSPVRPRDRALIALIDEFKYMSYVRWLAQFAADASKTWRTFGAHLWTMDQDAHTYIGPEGGVADPAMLSVWLNAAIKVVFRQDADPAQRLGDVIEGLRAAHVDHIKRLGRGEAVMVWEPDTNLARHNEIFVGRVEATDTEMRAFAGT